LGADGIAIGADGARRFSCPLGSRGPYRVATNALAHHTYDAVTVRVTVVFAGNRGGGADGLESDADGHIYATNDEHNPILNRGAEELWKTLAHDPHLLCPDTLSLATNRYLRVTANQRHHQPRYHDSHDLCEKPYALVRLRVDARPVLLARLGGADCASCQLCHRRKIRADQ
jgi:sugar lactone lactonase YvrE